MKENDKSLLCHVASKRGRKATMHILHLLPLLLKIESGILCQMNNWIMITWIIDTFLFIWNIMGHFPCLLTLCSALSRLVEMAPLLLMFIWSLEMCICWHFCATPLRVGVYLSVVFENVFCLSHWWKLCYSCHPGRMLHIPVLWWWLYARIFKTCWIYSLV